MKVLLVNGSPKANGNTARALAEVAEQLDAESIDTEVFQLGAKPIRDCIGCGQCGKLGGRCTFDDDVVNELIAAAEKACAEAGVKALVGKIATGDLFVGDSETKAAIEAKCAPDCVEMEGAAVSQIAAKNGVPCVILRAMSDNADEDGHEVLVVKKFSIAEYVATATKIVAAMVEAL